MTKVRCELCRDIVDNDVETFIDHLSDNHGKIELATELARLTMMMMMIRQENEEQS